MRQTDKLLVIAHSSELLSPQALASAMSGAGLQTFYRRVRSNTFWELGFNQSSLHRIALVSRNRPYNAFQTVAPLLTCCCSPPLSFRVEVGRLTQEPSPSSSQLSRVSYATLPDPRLAFSRDTTAKRGLEPMERRKRSRSVMDSTMAALAKGTVSLLQSKERHVEGNASVLRPWD